MNVMRKMKYARKTQSPVLRDMKGLLRVGTKFYQEKFVGKILKFVSDTQSLYVKCIACVRNGKLAWVTHICVRRVQ